MSDASDHPSPWASDGVPMSSTPVVVVWDDGTESEGPRGRDAPGGEDAHTSLGRSTRMVLVGALAVATVVIIGLLVWPRDRSDGDATAPATDADASATTLDTLPDQVAEAEEAVEAESGGDTTANRGADAVERAVDRVELPVAVAAVEAPTELIVQTTDGLIHTISLPSGTVRSVDLGTASSGQSFAGGALIAGPDAALIASYATSPYIIPRSGPPIEIDRAQFGEGDASDQITPYGWVTDESGATMFVVASYQPSDDSQSSFMIATDGQVTRRSGAPANFSFPVAAQGVQIVNDAGGAYVLAVDGTADRLTDGTVVGASQTDVLIRRCDEALNCRFVSRPIDARDGTPDERVVDLPDSLGNRYFGISLSPDSTAVAFTRYGESSGRIIIEFDGGRTIEGGNGEYGVGGAWARDGSGEFTSAAGPGITFLDRASGEAIVFGEELGQITAIASRYPDSELIDTLTLLDLDASTASTWVAPSTPGGGPALLFADDDGCVLSRETDRATWSVPDARRSSCKPTPRRA